MAQFFRIVAQQWAATAMSGEGARRFGGRWSPPGLPVVYFGESRSISALEILVHAGRGVIDLGWALIEVEVPDRLIERVASEQIPQGWGSLPSSPEARRFGAEWISRCEKPAILLPSAIIPEENVLMVNLQHPDFRKLRVSAPRPFLFDQRLG